MRPCAMRLTRTEWHGHCVAGHHGTMTRRGPAHQVKPFPAVRRLVADVGWMSRRKNSVRGLLEIDVTVPRQFMRAHKESTGESLSFTSYLAYCTGHAVAANKYLHAYRDWRGRLILFDDVDITTMIEVRQDGKEYPVGHIIRAANTKTFRQIHDEIRTVQARAAVSDDVKRLNVLLTLPGFVRRSFFLLMSRQPRMVKKVQGTVVLSAVGMFGSGGGWGLALPSHTLGITVGGITEKPGVHRGEIAIREYLNVTLDFDHDIVDGAPASRFAQRFRDLVEGGSGLQSV